MSNFPYNQNFFQPGMKTWYYASANSLFIFLKKDGDFSSTFEMEWWQIYQSHKIFTRIWKFHGILILQLKCWQRQTIWKCDKRSSRSIWRWNRCVWIATNKMRIFSCPRESKEFETKIFYLHEAIRFQPGLKFFI